MQTVLLVIHLMIIVALVGVVLLQRSEGGALGIGGGGGFMTSRGTANVLTRATAILAALFFLTSIGLSVLPRVLGSHQSILEGVKSTEQPQTGAPAGMPIGDGKNGVLNQLNDLVKQQQDKTGQQPADVPVAPAVEVPAAPVPAETAPAAAAPAETAPAAPAETTPAAPAETAPAAPAEAAPAAPTPAAPAAQ